MQHLPGNFLGKIWANLIRFGKNQNLASPKTLDLLWLCCEVFIIQVFEGGGRRYYVINFCLCLILRLLS